MTALFVLPGGILLEFTGLGPKPKSARLYCRRPLSTDRNGCSFDRQQHRLSSDVRLVE
jgi:hypothetical protein